MLLIDLLGLDETFMKVCQMLRDAFELTMRKRPPLDNVAQESNQKMVALGKLGVDLLQGFRAEKRI